MTRNRIARGLAAVAILAAAAVATSAFTKSSTGRTAPADRWLAGLDGKHGQFFDAPVTNDGIPLIHVLNYYDTYNKAYGVPDKDIDAVLTFYGATTFYGVNDAMWKKYELGKFTKANDATGAPFTRNPWRVDPTIIGMTVPTAGIEALQKRGATFILCNNALTIFSNLLAQARGLNPEAVYADLKANILPGVELVPGMVVAIEQGQDAGLSYHRQ